MTNTEEVKKLNREYFSTISLLRKEIDKILKNNCNIEYDFTNRIVIAKSIVEPEELEVWIIVPGCDTIRKYHSETLSHYGNSDNGDCEYYESTDIPINYLISISKGIIEYPLRLIEKYKKSILEVKEIFSSLENI